MRWSKKGSGDPFVPPGSIERVPFGRAEVSACPKCRSASAPGARQCSSCGYSFLETQVSTPSPTPTPAGALTPWPGQPEGPGLHSLVGETIDGRYRVLSVLGEGGFGVVFEVEFLLLDEPVVFAMKVLHPELARDEDFRLRFLREARLAMALSHQGVIQVRELGQSREGLLYFTMDHCEGESLAERLESTGCVPVREALNYTLQILDVLGVAHRRGILHRDLKPGNIFLTPVDPADPSLGDRVRIGDFGLAKDLSGDDTARIDITHGGIVGSPRYMSPEQAAGVPLDSRSDLFSLGMILYEMLYGIPPGERQLEDAREGLPRPTVTPSRQHVPSRVFEVVSRALATDVEHRPASAEDFARAIRELPEIRRAGTPRAGKLLRFSRKLFDWTAAAVLATVILGALLVYFESPRGQSTSQELLRLAGLVEEPAPRSEEKIAPDLEEPGPSEEAIDGGLDTTLARLPSLAGKARDYFFSLAEGSVYTFGVHHKENWGRGSGQSPTPSKITFRVIDRVGPSRVLVEASDDGQRFWWGLDESSNSIYQEFLLPHPQTGELDRVERRTLLQLPKDPTVTKLSFSNVVDGVSSRASVESAPLVTLHNETFRNCVKVTEYEEGQDLIVVRYYQKYGGEIGHLVYDRAAREYVYSRILLRPGGR